MTPKQVAQRIVNDIFTQGATRIALKRQKEKGSSAETDLGGWCKDAAIEQVEITLKDLAKGWCK